ncbi:hypothetical protein GLA29479_805 [Lysobacter antibioticus]|uniref:hypothetical protein n=1 Tax=Lysobacter antibioticus TaxID=84531 RepID=UPI0007174219|nr:hypothetical protein [Lysobacter antibioticus]ALN61689.1 hypothetical protein GLA29479_805 [Lysobacter antibioticus]
MRNFTALLYYLFALLGCDIGATTIVHRASADGIDIIDSEVRVTDRIAKFECLASRSGQCHYTLFHDDCAAADKTAPAKNANADACVNRPFERFAMVAGTDKEVIGLEPGFKLCVSAEDQAMNADCKSTARQ